MIKHVVLWKLKDPTRAEAMKTVLEALPAVIPEIQSLEVGLGGKTGEFFADIALVSGFASQADLDTYISHPEHRKAVDFIVPLVSERCVIDYEA